MAKVPYYFQGGTQPVEAPYGQAQFQNVRPDPDAFGAGIGAALEKVGSKLEKAGDVYYEHLMKMKAEENAAKATELDLKFYEESGKLKAEFNTLEGINSKNGLEKYQKDMHALHDRIAKEAPNDDVKRRYSSAVRSRIGFYNSEAAGRAATEFRKYTKSADDADVKLAHADAADAATTENEERFGEAYRRSEEAIKRSYGDREPPSEIQRRLQVNRQDITDTYIRSLAKKDPKRALELWETNKESLSYDAAKRTQLYDYINERMRTGQSKIEAKDITSGSAVPTPPREGEQPLVLPALTDKTPESMLPNYYAEAERRAAKQYSDDPVNRRLFADAIIDDVNKSHGMVKRIVAQNRMIRYNAVAESIEKNQYTDKDQFDPDTEEAYIKLEDDDKKRLKIKMDRIAVGDVPNTPARRTLAGRILNLAIDDVKTFLEIDARDRAKYDLTNAAVERIEIEQRRIRGGQQPDKDGFAGAMENIQPFLDSHQIKRDRDGTERNNEWLDFKARFRISREQWTQQYKKIPTKEEDVFIANRLIENRPSEGFFYRTRRQFELPYAAKEYIRKEWQKVHGPNSEPSPEQYQRYYDKMPPEAK